MQDVEKNNIYGKVNLELGVFTDTHGFEYPIVSYLDCDGEECMWDEAEYVIAGVEGRWFTLVLSEFNPTKKEEIQ